MKLLLVLLAVMTWTVESKNTVSLSDDSTVPYDIEVGYANTYNKGQVRANDTATLVLSHMEGITINGIEVFVKSNKSGGAGTFTVATNGQTVATKTGSFEEWFGAYDNTSYHALSFINRPINNVHMLTISLVGIANSLHIEKYVITYAPRPAYTVTLMNGNRVYQTLTEEAGMQGVMLPDGEEINGWEFAGWSETDFEDTPMPPTLHYPNTKFYPEQDCSLWAVYCQDNTPPITFETELTSGVYMYVNSEAFIALTGVPTDGKMAIAGANPYNNQQHYRFQFITPTTATITHEMTNTPIGYTSDAKMSATASVWNVYHDGEETLFYAEIGGKTYVLWLNILDTNNEFYAGLLKATPMSSPMRLLSTLVPARLVVYSCHPEAQGIEEVQEFNGSKVQEVLMHFGNYDLMIKDGQKYLIRK